MKVQLDEEKGLLGETEFKNGFQAGKKFGASEQYIIKVLDVLTDIEISKIFDVNELLIAAVRKREEIMYGNKINYAERAKAFETKLISIKKEKAYVEGFKEASRLEFQLKYILAAMTKMTDKEVSQAFKIEKVLVTTLRETEKIILQK